MTSKRNLKNHLEEEKEKTDKIQKDIPKQTFLIEYFME